MLNFDLEKFGVCFVLLYFGLSCFVDLSSQFHPFNKQGLIACMVDTEIIGSCGISGDIQPKFTS